MFYFSLYYHRFIGVWFIIGLLRHNAIHYLVMTFYLCEGDLDKQNGSNQYKISNYVEELKL